MKKISLLLLIAGLLAGPGYWIYAKFYTGSQATLVSLTRTEGKERAPVWRSPAFSLSRDMAPLGLILVARGRLPAGQQAGAPPKDHYTATLFKDGAAAQPLAFTLAIRGNSAPTDPVFREHLLLFQVVQDGRYQLEMAPVAPPAIPLDQVRLELRQHVLEPDSRVVTGGLLVLMLGILGLVLI